MTILTKPSTATQAEMEAGTETGLRRMTPERVAQAIAALAVSTADLDTFAELDALVADQSLVHLGMTDASTFGIFVDEDNMVSDSATLVPSQQSVKAYIDNVVAGLTALEAADIDTLAEINVIITDATLVTLAGTEALTNKTIDTASNTITVVEADISDLQSYLTAEANDLSAAVTWANVPDANVTESSVTQHEAAMSIEGAAVISTGEAGGTKFLREDGDGTSSWQAIAGGGDALVANPLSQFSSTTSLQLIGVLSDPTGTGAAVFATSPTLVTPLLGTPASGVLTNCTGYVGDSSLVTLGTVTAGVWSGTAIEGTAVASTGEAGGTKFLREDGDGTSSWQDPGAGLTHFTEGTGTQTTRYVKFVATHADSTLHVVIDPKGAGGFMLSEPDGTSAGGNDRGTPSVDLQTSISAATQVASGVNSFLGPATGCTASGAHSACITGNGNVASSKYGLVLNGREAQATRVNEVAHGWGDNSGFLAGSQGSEVVFWGQTLNATETEIFLDNASARLTVPTDAILSGRIDISAIQDSGAKRDGFYADFAIYNDGGTTVLFSDPVIPGQHGVETWSVSVEGDDTNDALVIKVTGEASTTITWVAVVRFAQAVGA